MRTKEKAINFLKIWFGGFHEKIYSGASEFSFNEIDVLLYLAWESEDSVFNDYISTLKFIGKCDYGDPDYRQAVSELSLIREPLELGYLGKGRQLIRALKALNFIYTEIPLKQSSEVYTINERGLDVIEPKPWFKNEFYQWIVLGGLVTLMVGLIEFFLKKLFGNT